MENKLLRLIYTVFLGLILAFFVGFGINTFYEPPQAPNMVSYYGEKEQPPTEEEMRAAEATWLEYDTAQQSYRRNVSMIALAGAVILLAISFFMERRNLVIANGILLGGVFTLIYSIARGIASSDSRYTFIVISIGLVIVLYLGLRHFSHPATAARPRKIRK